MYRARIIPRNGEGGEGRGQQPQEYCRTLWPWWPGNIGGDPARLTGAYSVTVTVIV